MTDTGPTPPTSSSAQELSDEDRVDLRGLLSRGPNWRDYLKEDGEMTGERDSKRRRA